MRCARHGFNTEWWVPGAHFQVEADTIVVFKRLLGKAGNGGVLIKCWQMRLVYLPIMFHMGIMA